MRGQRTGRVQQSRSPAQFCALWFQTGRPSSRSISQKKEHWDAGVRPATYSSYCETQTNLDRTQQQTFWVQNNPGSEQVAVSVHNLAHGLIRWPFGFDTLVPLWFLFSVALGNPVTPGTRRLDVHGRALLHLRTWAACKTGKGGRGHFQGRPVAVRPCGGAAGGDTGDCAGPGLIYLHWR